MMLLNPENEIIKESFQSSSGSALKSIDSTFSEFSTCEGWLHFEPADEALRLSLKLPAWRAVQQCPEALLAFKAAGYDDSVLLAKAEDGWDVSIQVPVEKIAERESLFTRLRTAILAAPLQAAINHQLSKKGGEFKPCTIQLNESGTESFSVACQGEQIVCLFSTAFPDQSDTILARVFLQELFDVRKEGRMGDAPAVVFGREPPVELAHLARPSASSLNYISIVLFPRHFQLPQVISLVPTLRDYLHYHLKCCKAFLHGRMRAKTADFLKILNRAKPENFS